MPMNQADAPLCSAAPCPSTHRANLHDGELRGLGLRRDIMDVLRHADPEQVDFLEVAPENWIGIGGRMGGQFRWFSERYPIVCHGLSLSLGGPAPLDETFLQRLKRFLSHHRVRYYSEHQSWCSDDGHLYDLLPIPFTEEAVAHVSERIRRTQEILEQRIAVENVSYYAVPGQQMQEIEFLNAVLEEADCDLLLDVNNIYVNAVNHGYDPLAFLNAVPTSRVAYLHIAGHYREAEDLIVDTHGADVIEPVWDLLDQAYRRFGVVPTLLERDFNIPSLKQLLAEMDRMSALQSKWSTPADALPHAARA
jgi:uncharacterized protein (UPF0276 family)